MTTLLNAIKRALDDTYVEPTPHFHQGATEDSPEVCFESSCSRPHLTA